MKSIRALGHPGEVIVAGQRQHRRFAGDRDETGALAWYRFSTRGYGSALRGGIAAARGKYVIMGDSDDSYDFTQLGPFVKKLNEGHDLGDGQSLSGGICSGRDAISASLSWEIPD